MLTHEKAPAHSQMIIGGLLETLMRQIDHPLKVVEVEGDALFMYAPKTDDAEAWSRRSQHLAKVVLKLFDAFQARLAELGAYSVCRCGACANLRHLTLKVVAHSGTALLNRVGDFSLLSGVDVIRAHRLLKNGVGGGSYLLMTDTAYADLPLPEGAEVESGHEEYDIGTIHTWVYRPELDDTIDVESIRGSFSDDNVAVKILRHELQTEYTEVACAPDRGFHFNTGRAAAQATEYPMDLVGLVPDTVVESFAGTGNPFSLGPIHKGEHVVDVGSGAGFDALLAGTMVGADGVVIGVDMTPAMIEKARAGASEMGVGHVEFREGHAEALPVPDGWADVVISNGVLNLSPDKSLALGEMFRVLRPGGRLQVGDITVLKPIPDEARQHIDLWTN